MNTMIRRLALTAAAVAAWFLPLHIALLALLLYVWASAMASTANTAKTRAVEARVAALVSSAATTNQNVATVTTNLAATTTTANNTAATVASGSTGTGLPAGVPTGGPNENQSGLATTDSSAYPTGTTSNASAGTAHTHDYGGHWHVLNFELPIATHTHDFDGHTHPLS